MRLRAVLFDLWGTLVLDPQERSGPRMGWRADRVEEVLVGHGCLVQFDAVMAALSEAARELGRMQDQGIDLKTGGRAELFAKLYEDATSIFVPATALADLEEAIGAMPEAFQPVEAPGATAALAAVKAAGLATALVSNAGLTISSHLRRMIRDYEMTPHFDYMVFSDDLGVAKPNPQIFATALNGIHLSASVCAYVGDSPHNDIWGAANAGMFTVQIGGRQKDGVVPDLHIDQLADLVPMLGKQESSASFVTGQHEGVAL